LLDPLTPLLGLTVLHATLVLATMLAIELERQRLAQRLAMERLEAARTAGELEAARRIQTGMLPRSEVVLADETRVDLFATMRPAREVGGDLYDFFYLDRRRMFVVVGDVAGKGLAAALFMAVSKALTKSSSLRDRIGLTELMAVINRELARDNPDDLFVTLLAMVLDLDNGRLEYCNAGHEPLLMVRTDGSVQVLDEGGGPPLCVLEDASYLSASVSMQPGEWLALTSDGITEAMSPDGDLFGREALRALLRATDETSGSAEALGRLVLRRVAEFEAGVDPVDDQTLLLLRWRGSSGR
jgi:serine phosphatase RsbU (regulator of sigma subunit)